MDQRKKAIGILALGLAFIIAAVGVYYCGYVIGRDAAERELKNSVSANVVANEAANETANEATNETTNEDENAVITEANEVVNDVEGSANETNEVVNEAENTVVTNE